MKPGYRAYANLLPGTLQIVFPRGHMTAIFGEKLLFPQENGPNVMLVVYGDEFYARYETEEGYTAIYDLDLGLYCYAFLKDGSFVSSGIGIDKSPPEGIAKHVEESNDVRAAKAHRRFL